MSRMGRALSLALMGGWIAVSAVAQDDMAGEYEYGRTQAAREAASYVTAALSRPLDQLYKESGDGTTHSALRLGLALFAGRGSDIALDAGDRDILIALEARVRPLAEAYMQEHPDAAPDPVAWRRILKVSDAEMAAVERFEKTFLADYWLNVARISYASAAWNQWLPDSGRAGPRVAYRDTRRITVGAPIERNVQSAAVHCMSAVREAAGRDHVTSSRLATSLYLLWEYAPYDAQVFAEYDLHRRPKGENRRYNLIMGKAACGTEAQFDAYVRMLKAQA